MARPDWMVPGADVAVLSGNHRTQSVRLTKIDRVLKRDVVLTNGERFRADHPTRSSGGAWYGNDDLLPADHPRVLAARERMSFERARNSLRTQLSNYEARSRDAKDMDDLRDLVADLRRDLEAETA